MTIGNTESIAGLRPQLWEKELFKDVMDNLYFTENGMMGEDDNNIIQIKTGLMKVPGDRINFGLTAKLTGDGVDGDDELEGQEEKINAYSESVAIDQKRFAVRLKGKLDEKKNGYNMRTDAKGKLSIRMQEFIERQFFLKLGGVTLTSLTDVNGTVYSAGAAWSNSPDAIPTADTGAGFGARYLCADFANGADSLASTDLITPALLSRAKIKAQLATPKIRPLRIKGKNFYVVFMHPWQWYDFKRNPEIAQALREAGSRGDENPLFTGAELVWDGLIIHVHEYVPFLDADSFDNYNAAASGTNYSADCFRALLVGRQACGFAQAVNPNGWVEETFDYKNKTGFATGLIGGIQKLLFNSKEYGVIAIDTAATALT